MLRKITKTIMWVLVLFVVGASLFLVYDQRSIGKTIASYKGVPVHYNGILFIKSHGKHYSSDGYYYGQKWQCVEYIKRFYDQAKNHQMPNVYGHAKDFFDVNVPHGTLNKTRNLVQYKNGENERPQPDDLIVFNNTKYGHVAIVTQVTDKYIEVIQQNILGKPLERFTLKNANGKWFIGQYIKPVGWLRKQ